MKIELEPGYVPSKKEEYMNTKHLAYFKQKLIEWKQQLIAEAQDTMSHLKEDKLNEPDPGDRAMAETETAFELRTRDRYRKLITKIDKALDKVEDKSYGYCEETGDPIGLGRLEARPIATLCIEAQEKHENFERQHSED